jgi:hypothetical protein
MEGSGSVQNNYGSRSKTLDGTHLFPLIETDDTIAAVPHIILLHIQYTVPGWLPEEYYQIEDKPIVSSDCVRRKVKK